MTIAEIAAEIRELCDASTTDYGDTSLLRRFNSAQETLVSKILKADGTWQFDDRNFTTIPVGVATLVNGQAQYAFSDIFLDIEQVSIKDTNSSWRVLEPVDPKNFRDISIEDYFNSTGLPEVYDKQGNTVTLYPAPSSSAVTLSGGLKVRFKRTAYQVSSAELSTGTLVPGIATPWHITLAKMTALPYCKSYKKDRVPELKSDIEVETKECLAWYARREKDSRKIMTTKPISFR